MSRRGRKGGPVKEGILSVVSLLFVIGLVLGWAKANDINSYTSVQNYFKSWSDEINRCGYINWISGGCSSSPLPSSPSKPKGEDTTGSGKSKGEGKGGVGSYNPVVADDKLEIDEYQKMLDNLTIKASTKEDYDRGEWKHWTGSPCNSRQQVLIDQGEDVVVEEKRCKVTSGTWVCPFGLEKFTNPSKIDIDHVVPLGWANRNGGAKWDKEKKEEFANDFNHLLATSAKENRSKGDKGPGDYLPPNKDYHCTYSKIWIFTLDKYSLSIPKKDFSALDRAFQSCKV